MGFQRKSFSKRLTVSSGWCYTFATLFSGTMESPTVPYPTWRRTTTSSDPPCGSEDVFFNNMLKTAANFVPADSDLRRTSYGAPQILVVLRSCRMVVLSMPLYPHGSTEMLRPGDS